MVRVMTFTATVVKVLMASPRDTSDLRDAVEQALHEWNGDRALQSGVVLLPRRWETNAVPLLTGQDGQTVINQQLVTDADIVIGIFHSTLGSATPRAASGTAEELGASHEAGKPVHVYFSAMPIPRDHDREALALLDAFKGEISRLGLYGSFDTPVSLKDQVKRAIEHDLGLLGVEAPSADGVAPQKEVSLRVSYDYVREPNRQGRMQTKRQRLIVTNDGTATAEDVTLAIEVPDEETAPHMLSGAPVPFTLAPHGGEYSVPIITSMGTVHSGTVRLRWDEAGESRESTQTVSFV